MDSGGWTPRILNICTSWEQLSLYMPSVADQFPATVQYGIPSVAKMTKRGIMNAILNRWRQQYRNDFSIPLRTSCKWILSIILLRFFQLCEECKPRCIPNLLCLYPQLMGKQSGVEFAVSNIIEMKPKKLLNFCYVIWNWNCIKIYECNKYDTKCFMLLN
jgi:hypothetical protein